MKYTQEDLDKVLNKFIESDLYKTPSKMLNIVEAHQSKTDFLAHKPDLVNELAKPFNNPSQMISYKGKNEKQINAAGWLITTHKIPRPKWFDSVETAKIKAVSKIDHTARTAKIDFISLQKKRLQKIDFSTIYANRDEKARVEKWVKKVQKPVSQFDLQGNFIKDWDSATIAAKELNLQFTGISMCCRGKLNKCGGFIWKFKQENP